ncbi:MAG: CatB-related O-acetyltransferase, partial [Selenomonadaceae bacterium]|nr:CatB-related O-acetyltransferase [Selenomonadaceae bacterium]
MNFKMNLSPRDEKIFHGETMNVVTFGRGSYSSPFSVTVQFGNMNILSGRFCSLAGGINFSMGGNHPVKSVTTSPIDVAHIVKGVFGEVRPNLRPVPNMRVNRRQIIFGHDVWIGDGATIMGGVKIGNGAVIGAKSVVAKDIPPYAIAVGNPARVIKYRFDEETIKKFLAVKWWNWSLEKIADNFPLMNDVENFLETHYSPALEEFPEDDFSRQINNFGGVLSNVSFYPRLSSQRSAVVESRSRFLSVKSRKLVARHLARQGRVGRRYKIFDGSRRFKSKHHHVQARGKFFAVR